MPLPDDGATVAVKVTDWPKTEGFSEEARVVVVAMPAGLIVTETALDVLPVKLESPRYFAVSESVPTGSVVVVRIAVLPLRLAVPREVVPTKNCTEPVGVPAPGATTAIVAVSVTAWPAFVVVGVAERLVVVLAWLDGLVRGRGARHEIRVAAVDRRDRVRPHGEGRGREADRAAGSQGLGVQDGRALLECDGPRRRAGAGSDHADSRGERHRLTKYR